MTYCAGRRRGTLIDEVPLCVSTCVAGIEGASTRPVNRSRAYLSGDFAGLNVPQHVSSEVVALNAPIVPYSTSPLPGETFRTSIWSALQTSPFPQ